MIIENPPIAHSQMKKNAVVLILSNFFQGIGWGIFYTIYQSFLLKYISSESLLGIVVSLSFLLQYAPMPFFGKLSDKIGRKILILWGMIIPIVGLLLIGLAPNFFLILIGFILFYVAWSIRDPPFQTALNDNILDGKSGFIFGVSSFCFFSGNLIANIAISQFSQSITHEQFFLIFAGLYGLQAIIIALFYKEKRLSKEIRRRNAKNEPGIFHYFKSLLSDLKKRPLFVFFLIDTLIWGIGTILLNGSLESQLHFSNANIAFVLMGYNLTVILSQIPLGKIVDRLGVKRSVIFAELFGMIFYAITIIGAFLDHQSQLWVIFSGQVIYGFALAFYIPAQMVVFTNSSVEHAAETYGIGNLAVGIGAFPATIIAGFLIEKIGFIAPLICAMVLLPINLLTVFRKFEHIDSRVPPQNEPDSNTDSMS